MAMELFLDTAGIKALHVPFRGIAAAINEMVGGRVDMAIGSLASGLAQVQAGTLLGLAHHGSRAQSAASRRSDLRGCRPAEIQRAVLVRTRGAGRHARAGDRTAQPRGCPRLRATTAARRLRQAGRGRGHVDAGRDDRAPRRARSRFGATSSRARTSRFNNRRRSTVGPRERRSARLPCATALVRRPFPRVRASRAISAWRGKRDAALRAAARAACRLSRAGKASRHRAVRARAAERLRPRQFLHARRDARSGHRTLPRHRRRGRERARCTARRTRCARRAWRAHQCLTGEAARARILPNDAAAHRPPRCALPRTGLASRLPHARLADRRTATSICDDEVFLQPRAHGHVQGRSRARAARISQIARQSCAAATAAHGSS